LTPEQEEIAAAPPERRALVTAGAGTGKTHILIERLASLAGHYGLSLANDVLVMSFSRAAVLEIRRRMTIRGGAVPYGAVVTFDSFASGLLARHSGSRTWASGDFDARVEAANALLESSSAAQAEIRSLKHVIVDEVQDLVGVRRVLVQSLLEHSAGGFTLFGDPAQGIYNFQAVDPVERRLGASILFEWVKAALPGAGVDVLTLHRNFRYQTPQARIAEWAGAKLNSIDPDYSAILEVLEESIFDVEPLGTIDEFVADLAATAEEGDRPESIGILCPYNFQVLRISQNLAARRVPHHYQRAATDRTLPAWVGRALRTCESARLGQSRFDELIAPHADVPDHAWALLKRLDPGGSRDSVDIQRVQERIRLADIPAELASPSWSSVTVSTIHRAKGLEFDRVVVFEPADPLGEDGDDIPERTRQTYVALTRARRRYGYLDRPAREFANRRGNPGGVWVVRGFAGKRRYVREVEIQGGHAWKQDPAGAFAFGADAEQIQQYIDASVRPFDPLLLRRVVVNSVEGPLMYYVIEHNGQGVGVADIGWILKPLCRPKFDRNWPSVIEGVVVESVDTVAGTSAAGMRAGLTSSGVWLRVRPYGLGTLRWGQVE